MSRSVHDNHLISFEVDGVAKRIILHTKYAYGEEPYDQTDVVFEGVLDHYFRNPILPSILFDIEETEALRILTRDLDLINEGHKIGGWPSFWRDSASAMSEAITAAGCRMFEISSSYGLDGWVVATCCEFNLVNATGENNSEISSPITPRVD